jgi:hypothetical protein
MSADLQGARNMCIIYIAHTLIVLLKLFIDKSPTTEGYVHFRMVKPLPIMLGKVQGEPIRASQAMHPT